MTDETTTVTIDYRPAAGEDGGYSWQGFGQSRGGYATAEDACDGAYEAWGHPKGVMLYEYTDSARSRMRKTGEDREPDCPICSPAA